MPDPRRDALIQDQIELCVVPDVNNEMEFVFSWNAWNWAFEDDMDDGFIQSFQDRIQDALKMLEGIVLP
jgi:hypothetical protein